MSKPQLQVGRVETAVAPRPIQDWTPPRRVQWAVGVHTFKAVPTHFQVMLDDSSEGWTARVLAHTPVPQDWIEKAEVRGEEVPIYQVVPLVAAGRPQASAARALTAVRKDVEAFLKGLETTEAQMRKGRKG